ncbi:hypothetical protein [Streptomyces sp. NBC_01296]|uniref:hypothetical protein n=1 Tax=Streptomyces sp. NBC_01296 TaxID=2903816 RepID=UPI002E0E2489|nr:hypothetical protein OG299_00890 [Streptomyces sp. NBC_01296]
MTARYGHPHQRTPRHAGVIGRRQGGGDVHLDDALLIEWRGGGPAVWSPDTGEE